MEYDHDSARLFLCSVSSCLSEDLWVEIFKRLPIETLCQFQCVCKWGNSLISSAFFINLHHSLSLSSTTPPNLKLYLLVHVGGRRSHYSSALYFPQESHVEHLRRQVHFPFRWVRSWINLTCVDVVRGVICLSSSLESSFDSPILWNPAIRKYVTLPPLGYPTSLGPAQYFLEDDNYYFNSTIPRVFVSAIGFGYESSKNDFKVVRFWIHEYGTPSPPTYEVYSAREGVWRVATIDNITSCELNPDNSRTGCFVNGTIHWLLSTPVERGSFDMIHSVLMFDCELEEFKTMELPREIYKADIKTMEEYRTTMELEGDIVRPDALDGMTCLEVLEYGGMLSVLVRRDWEHFVELWVMEENGVGRKWEKLYRIPDGQKSDGIDVYRPSFGNLPPYGSNQFWIKFRKNYRTVHCILDGHVYEESMFFMDDTKARSYTKDEIVHF